MLPSLPLALLCIPCPPRIPPINEDPAVFVATWRAASRTPKNRVALPQEPRRIPPRIALRSSKNCVALPKSALRPPKTAPCSPHCIPLHRPVAHPMPPNATICPYQRPTILVPTPYQRHCILGFQCEIPRYSGAGTGMVRRW